MAESQEIKPSVIKTEAQWREQLSDFEFRVLREAATEPPHVGSYTDTATVGVYRCKGCNTELFRSETKFDARCGWPSFFEPLAKDQVTYHTDHLLGYPRTEVRCATCDSHLGHVFSGEGFPTPTDLRYCINSIALSLEPSSTTD